MEEIKKRKKVTEVKGGKTGHVTKKKTTLIELRSHRKMGWKNKEGRGGNCSIEGINGKSEFKLITMSNIFGDFLKLQKL